MARQRITVELDDELIRGLGVLGEPGEVGWISRWPAPVFREESGRPKRYPAARGDAPAR